MVVPQEVPLGPRDFVNREADLARMDRFWGSRSSGVAQLGVCIGLPGVGKTAFIRRCVQRFRDARMFSGGDLHVEFATADGIAPSVADALASCLLALGVAKDVMPSTLAERANQLRSITAEKPVLIVLEDVTDAAQVLPFVPNGADSAVLVTSSAQMSDLLVEGAEAIRLAPLDDASGAHLLTTLVGARAEAEPEAVGRLVLLCSGLPVALKVAASRLLARPNLRVDALVAQIDSGLSGFAVGGRDKVSAVFAVAYEALEPVAARIYRLLGLYPGRDLTLDTLASLAGVGQETLSSVVEALIESGLLNEDSDNRLSLHAMVRRHAQQLAYSLDGADECEAAVRRVVTHLVTAAAFADLAVLGPGRYRVDPDALAVGRKSPFPDDDSKGKALAWLDRERGNLLAVQRAAADLGMHDESWRLAEALSALYVTRRYLVDWTESSDLGATSARLTGNARAEARLRSFASRAWTDLGDLGRAGEELVDRALPLAEEAGDTRLLASVWEMLGRFRDHVDPEGAAAAYQRAIVLFTQEFDTRGTAFTSFFFGCSHHRAGRLQEAEDILRTALAQIREVGDLRMLGRCLTELGNVLRAGGQVKGARLALDEAIRVLHNDDQPYYEAIAQESLLAVVKDDGLSRSTLRTLADIHQRLGSGRADEFRERLRLLQGSAMTE
ncbi:NB-ARC domain-containing protein [Amycolatopsis sp. NPDC049868]|uniref:NB-ARC domain-containing protein n=1 Tax=Amycolatopsis sp. NPDC049868 TaxID=3363934 RepID=UPI00379D4A1F